MSIWMLSSSVIRAEVGSVAAISALDVLKCSSCRSTMKSLAICSHVLPNPSKTNMWRTERMNYPGEAGAAVIPGWVDVCCPKGGISRGSPKPELPLFHNLETNADDTTKVKFLYLTLMFVQVTEAAITVSSCAVVMNAEGGKRTSCFSWGEPPVDTAWWLSCKCFGAASAPVMADWFLVLENKRRKQ